MPIDKPASCAARAFLACLLCRVSCAQVELLDTGSVAELLTPLPSGKQQKDGVRWDHHPIHGETKSSLDL